MLSFRACATPSPRVLGRRSPAARKPSASSSRSRDGVVFVASLARGEGRAAALYSLADKAANAGALRRHARGAELSARAALKAEAFLGLDSLVAAHLRMNECNALAHLAASSSCAEQEALYCRSWSTLLSVIALLQRRHNTSTLLAGTERKEESDYYAHVIAAMLVAQNKPVPPPFVLQIFASSIGYTVLLNALHKSLVFLFKSLHPLWPAEQRMIVETFVRSFLTLLSSPRATDAFLTGPSLFRYFKL